MSSLRAFITQSGPRHYVDPTPANAPFVLLIALEPLHFFHLFIYTLTIRTSILTAKKLYDWRNLEVGNISYFVGKIQ